MKCEYSGAFASSLELWLVSVVSSCLGQDVLYQSELPGSPKIEILDQIQRQDDDWQDGGEVSYCRD